MGLSSFIQHHVLFGNFIQNGDLISSLMLYSTVSNPDILVYYENCVMKFSPRLPSPPTSDIHTQSMPSDYSGSSEEGGEALPWGTLAAGGERGVGMEDKKWGWEQWARTTPTNLPPGGPLLICSAPHPQSVHLCANEEIRGFPRSDWQ